VAASAAGWSPASPSPPLAGAERRRGGAERRRTVTEESGTAAGRAEAARHGDCVERQRLYRPGRQETANGIKASLAMRPAKMASSTFLL